MDCLLHLASAICLIQPSGLTLRGDVSIQVAGDVSHWSGRRDYGGGHMAHLSLELPLLTYRGFAITTSYTHESLLETRSDRGEERIGLGFRWEPFR